MVFVNGLPLGIIKLKNAASESATVEQAYQQLQTYKEQIPSLFRTNAVMVASDGMLARVGSLTADAERFMPRRSVTGARVISRRTALTRWTRFCGASSTNIVPGAHPRFYRAR